MIRLKALLAEQPEDPKQLSQVNLTSDRTFKDPNLQKIYDQYRAFVKELDALHQQYGHNVKHKLPIPEQPNKSDLQNLLSSVKKQLQDDRQMFEKAYEYSAYIPKTYWTDNNLTVWDLINSSKGLAAMRAHYNMLPDRVFMDYYNTFGKWVDPEADARKLSPNDLAELREKWAVFRLFKDADIIDVLRITTKEAVIDSYNTIDSLFPGLLKCWLSGWDCFINGEEHGIRTFLYTWTGVATQGVLSLNPFTALGIEVCYCLLIIDDVKRMAEGKLDIITSLFNLIFDTIGLLTVGTFSGIGKAIKTKAATYGKIFNEFYGEKREIIRKALVKGFDLKKTTELEDLIKLLDSLGKSWVETLKTICDTIVKAGKFIIKSIMSLPAEALKRLAQAFPVLYPAIIYIEKLIVELSNSLVVTIIKEMIDISTILQKLINEYLSGAIRVNQVTVDESLKLKPLLTHVKFT